MMAENMGTVTVKIDKTDAEWIVKAIEAAGNLIEIARQEEREACAEIVDARLDAEDLDSYARGWLEECVQSIRDRGEAGYYDIRLEGYRIEKSNAAPSKAGVQDARVSGTS